MLPFKHKKIKNKNTHAVSRGGIISFPPTGEEGSIVEICSSIFDVEFRISGPGKEEQNHLQGKPFVFSIQGFSNCSKPLATRLAKMLNSGFVCLLVDLRNALLVRLEIAAVCGLAIQLVCLREHHDHRTVQISVLACCALTRTSYKSILLWRILVAWVEESGITWQIEFPAKSPVASGQVVDSSNSCSDGRFYKDTNAYKRTQIKTTHRRSVLEDGLKIKSHGVRVLSDAA